jgi:glycerol-3-phosphate acyltransferase PlsY
METSLIIISAYLWGAFPTAFVVSGYAKNVDIRNHGSGNVGASNVTELLGWKVGLSVGIFDCIVKGALPVVVAMFFEVSLAVQASVGLAAIVGHNWSPFIRFTGGRGVATVAGVYLGFLMWAELLVLAILLSLVRRQLIRDSALWTLLSLMLVPILAHFLFHRETEVITMAIAIGILLILKRLTANWKLPENEYDFWWLLVYRLLWDRDVPRKTQWVKRDQSQSQ